MTYDEIKKQALDSINKVRIKIKQEVFINGIKNKSRSFEDCYDIANNAAWNYVKCLCENNEMYDVIRQVLEETETNTIQYAYLAAGGLNTPANEISE